MKGFKALSLTRIIHILLWFPFISCVKIMERGYNFGCKFIGDGKTYGKSR